MNGNLMHIQYEQLHTSDSVYVASQLTWKIEGDPQSMNND